MFVFSFKANKPKLIIALCVVICVLIAGTLALGGRKKPVVNDKVINYKAKTASECITFFVSVRLDCKRGTRGSQRGDYPVRV